MIKNFLKAIKLSSSSSITNSYREMDDNKLGMNMKLHAIMIAFPFQGHLNPFVNLAIKLASNGFTITFVHTEYVHHLISKSHHNTDEVDLFLESRKSGLDIHYMTISDGLPLEFDRETNFLVYWETVLNDFPAIADKFIQRLIESFDPLVVPFLVADTVYAWPATVAHKYNLVNVSFWTEPALVFAINYYTNLLRENGDFPRKDDAHHVINYIPGVESINTKDLMSFLQEADETTFVHKIVFDSFKGVRKADFILCNTVQELEPDTLLVLNQEHPTYAIGPLNFSTKTKVSRSLLSEVDCNKWLNSKTSGSVLYVSFGSVVHTNKEVIEEVAHGLLLSGVNFIWAIRHDIVRSMSVTDILPVGFMDSIKGRGLIVPWCDQNVVLSNSVVGGFLTHCGWNSIVESIYCGVPMICYPVTYDQPTNRKIVVNDWKVGINLCDGSSVTREEVATKVNMLMCGKIKDGINEKIKKLQRIMHDALTKDGSSNRNFDQFLEDFREKIISKWDK